MKPSGSRYSSPRRTPQCRQLFAPGGPPSQCVGPDKVPSTLPRTTAAPTLSGDFTGSKLSRSPSLVAMVSTGRSTTTPEYVTVPAVGARISAPCGDTKSTPRCPLSQGLSGGSKKWATRGRPPAEATGQPQASEAGRGSGVVALGKAALRGKAVVLRKAAARVEAPAPGNAAGVGELAMAEPDRGSRAVTRSPATRRRHHVIGRNRFISPACTHPRTAAWPGRKIVGKSTPAHRCGGPNHGLAGERLCSNMGRAVCCLHIDYAHLTLTSCRSNPNTAEGLCPYGPFYNGLWTRNECQEQGPYGIDRTGFQAKEP
jgi:hypothetical protein